MSSQAALTGRVSSRRWGQHGVEALNETVVCPASRALHVEAKTWLNALAFANTLENVSDSSCGSDGNRLASVELRVVPVELGQPKQLFGELLQRSFRTRNREFEWTRNVHARIRLEKLDTSSQVQDSSAGLKVEKSSSQGRVSTCAKNSCE